MKKIASLPKSIYIYTIPERDIERLLDIYVDYVTNPYSELRQRANYHDSRIDMGIGDCSPIPAEKRALRYKYNPLMPHDEEPVVENLPKPHRDSLRTHFISLLDIIYRRVYSFQHGEQRFNASILQEVFRYYAYVLDVLRAYGIIRGATYSSIEICKPFLFTREKCTNKRVIAELGAFHERAYRRWQSKMKIAGEIANDSFVKRYNKCLNFYNLIDEDRALSALNSIDFKSKESENYYRKSIENFSDIQRRKDKAFYGALEDVADINGRWYHLAVQTPHAIRPYTNIQFTIDARNSQLVLFNYFLINYYIHRDINIFTTFSRYNSKILQYHLYNYIDNIQSLQYGLNHLSNLSTPTYRISTIEKGLQTINKELISLHISNNQQFKLYSKLYFIILTHIYNSDIYKSSTNHIHYKRLQYDTQELCNKLKHSGFGGDILEKVSAIPTNVKRYIYQSSHGVLWDTFAAKWGLSRDAVKKAGFGNIFYSYAHAPVQDTTMRDAFRREYRDVYKVLTYYKTSFAEQCDKYGLIKIKTLYKPNGDIFRARGFLQLPHKLTQLESSLFYDILREIFKNDKVMAVGIHDAIAVLNDEITPEEVAAIMRKTYEQYGLVASFKIEHN